MSYPQRNDEQHKTVHAGLPPRANLRPPPMLPRPAAALAATAAVTLTLTAATGAAGQ